MGPSDVMNKMRAILTHVGAWAPMAEQKAVAKFLGEREAIKTYLVNYKKEIEERLRRIYDGFMQLKNEGSMPSHPLRELLLRSARTQRNPYEKSS